MSEVEVEVRNIFGQIFIDNIKVPKDLLKKSETNTDENGSEDLNDDNDDVDEDNEQPDNNESDEDTNTKRKFWYEINAKTQNIGLNKDRRSRFITIKNKKIEKTGKKRKTFSQIETANVLLRNDFVLINGVIGCVMEFRKNVPMTAPVSQFKHEPEYAIVSEDVLVRLQL